MVRLILVVVFVLLVLGATAIILLGPAAFAETRNVVVGRPAPAAKSARTLNRTWQNRPATTPPEVEIVPRRTAFPIPVKPLNTSAAVRSGTPQIGNSTEHAGVSRRVTLHSPAGSGGFTARHALAAASGAEVTTIDDSLTRPARFDPVSRARADLACLHRDPKARQAFYDDLRRIADQVRAGDEPSGQNTLSACSAFTEMRAIN